MPPNSTSISAIAPEISPRVQPNSWLSGNISTAGMPTAPAENTAVTKVSATITHP